MVELKDYPIKLSNNGSYGLPANRLPGSFKFGGKFSKQSWRKSHENIKKTAIKGIILTVTCTIGNMQKKTEAKN